LARKFLIAEPLNRVICTLVETCLRITNYFEPALARNVARARGTGRRDEAETARFKSRADGRQKKGADRRMTLHHIQLQKSASFKSASGFAAIWKKSAFQKHSIRKKNVFFFGGHSIAPETTSANTASASP